MRRSHHPGEVKCYGGCGKICEKRHPTCLECRNATIQNELPHQSIEERVTTNAATLLQSLPIHSHHRAPLLNALSQNLSIDEAAQLFQSSQSHIRQSTDKRLLRSQYNTSELERKLPSPNTLNWGSGSASDLSHLIGRFATNTQTFTLPIIPRNEELKPNIKGIEGIKSRHSFIYENDECKFYEKTNSEISQVFHFVPIA